MSIRFDLTESQSLLQKNVRDFLERECPESLVREAEESDLSHSPELWQKLAGVGFLGLAIPEQYGGAGGFFDLGLFFEEAGRVLMPGPHLATLAITAPLIAAHGTGDQKQRLLPAIASGRAIVSLAMDERDGECRPEGIATLAQRAGDGHVLNGTKLFIKDTAAASHLLVTARHGHGGFMNALIDASAPGVSVRRFRVLSGDMLAEVQLEGVRVAADDVIGVPGRGWQELAPALDRGKACLAAQMAGAADALMRKTVDYMNGRVTFGRPISSYQALQHRMSQIAMLVYGARHLAYNVLWKLSEGIDCAGEVAMAKFFASDAYRHTTNESLQFHGAFGYSLEYAVQLYWRRMRLDEVVLGDSLLEREAAAEAIGIESMLDDLTIIELGQGIAPAFCAKLFAGFGAEVIKIEPPAGDALRSRGPFANDEPGPERSGLFAYVNTSKLGVTLDVASERGRALLLGLIRDTDILIENNTPSWMEEHHLDYERLREINPSLIVTSITPFGQDGPWRDYLANDFIVQHTGGIAYSNGVRARDPEAEPPVVIPGYAGEFAGSLAAAAATMCALFARDATGEGQHVDVALQEALAMHLQVDLSRVTYAGEVPRRAASAQPPVPYVGQQPVADGYVDFVVRTEDHWRRLLDVFNHPEWSGNELFATMTLRSQYWDALEPLIQQETGRLQKEDLFRKSQEHGVSAAAVYTVEDAARSGHFADRGCFVQHEHPVIGRMRAPGPPVRFAGAHWAIRRPAPLLGEHNGEVFARLGVSAQELAALRQEGIV